jgi:surface carbohydrate biosynthesis protein (TIGR04326 family)
MTAAASLVIWDQKDDPPPASGSGVLCWQSYAQGESIRSIPRYLEEHAEHIRDRYLAFVQELGEHRIGGKRVLDHLDLGDGFSLWWMTLLAEKNPFKSPRIYDCLRLIALEEIVTEKRPSALMLVSPDRVLAGAMRQLCESAGIGFHWQASRRSGSWWSLRRLYAALPVAVQGLLSLRHVAFQWPLRKLKAPEWFADRGAICFCSYFTNLDPARCAQGHFYSRQWEVLPGSLRDGGRQTNWLQLFLPSALVPDAAVGLRWARRFNYDARHQERHAFVESYLHWTILLRALKNWLWLYTVGWRLSGIRLAFSLKGSLVSVWPLLRDDWQSSLSGPVGFRNCLWIALFDAALADMPHQHTGLYLYENQPWERALLRAWRRHGHGRIIGVQHSTTPFWWLPHAERPSADASCASPQPDQLAVNGAAAWQAFVSTGFPVERLIEVEALRYLSLAKLSARADAGKGPDENRSARDSPDVKVLVLGDIAPTSTRHLMNLLQGAIELIPAGYSFTFKPHPAGTAGLADYPHLFAERTDAALGDILQEYDVAVAANSTSASLDAFIAGLPVIIGLDGDSLNLSPLRGHSGAHFVSTCAEMAGALKELAHRDRKTGAGRTGFFVLDPNLPRWKRLLAYDGVTDKNAVTI